jgi:hypothetical protein
MRSIRSALGAMFAIVAMAAAPAHAQLPVPLPAVGGLTALPVVDPSQSVDLIVNGGFELTASTGQASPVLAPEGPWQPTAASVSAWSVDGTSAHGGKSSMKMSGVAGAEAYETFYLSAGVYTFTGYIKTASGGTGRARLMLDMRNGPVNTLATPNCVADCGINVWYTTQEISSGATWTQVSVTFNITDDNIAASKPSQPGKIKAYAVLDGYWASARLTAWYDDVRLLQQGTFPLDVFMRYPNYRGMLFSDQDQTLRFQVTPQAAYASGGYSVQSTLTGPDGVLETTITPLTGLAVDAETGKPGVQIALNTGNQIAGAVADYGAVTAEFTLLDSDHGNAVVPPTYPAYSVVKVPGTVKPLMNVTVNPQNQIVLGIPRPNNPAQNPLKMPPAPRFTLGVYDSGLGSVSSTTNWEQLLFDPAGARRMAGLPINLYLNYYLGDTGADTINNLISTLNNRSIAYLQTGNCFSNQPASSHNAPTGFKIDQPGADQSFPYITQPPPTGIGQAVGGYYTADECTADMVGGVFQQYRRLMAKDPDSMAFGALLGSADLPLWRDALDVLSTDPYPMYGAEPVGGYYHGVVADWTRMAVRAVQRNRPVMTVLQFFKFDASRSSQGRWPTLNEMRNHAYMAIIEGAKGLMWWSLGDNALDTACRNATTWCAQRTDLMTQLKSVVSELAALEPVLLMPDSPALGNVVTSVRQSTPAAPAVATTSIRTMVKHDEVTGKNYLFAYNTTPYYNAGVTTPSVTVQFTLPSTPGSITVYGENRSITASATFSDTFGPFAAHVYEIQ